MAKKPRAVYTAYTRSDSFPGGHLIRVYGSYDRAFDWIFKIASRYDVRVLPGLINGADAPGSMSDAVVTSVVNAPNGRQSWWIEKVVPS